VREHAAKDVEVIVTDDLSLAEVEDESIDSVLVSNLLEHLPDFIAVLDLMSRIHDKLRTNGSLFILQPNYRLTGARYFDFVDHSMILTETSLEEALNATGFEIRERKVRFLPYTSKSRLPLWPWLVAAYLRFPPARWLLGKQTFVAATKIPTLR
jgi:SAM-dependent methyltransferase